MRKTSINQLASSQLPWVPFLCYCDQWGIFQQIYDLFRHLKYCCFVSLFYWYINQYRHQSKFCLQSFFQLWVDNLNISCAWIRTVFCSIENILFMYWSMIGVPSSTNSAKLSIIPNKRRTLRSPISTINWMTVSQFPKSGKFHHCPQCEDVRQFMKHFNHCPSVALLIRFGRASMSKRKLFWCSTWVELPIVMWLLYVVFIRNAT